MPTLDPEDQPDQPEYLGELSTKLPAGATFKQASEHMLTCQYIDSVSTLNIAQLREVAKALSALYVGMQVTASAMCKQDFSFPTNIDGV